MPTDLEERIEQLELAQRCRKLGGTLKEGVCTIPAVAQQAVTDRRTGKFNVGKFLLLLGGILAVVFIAVWIINPSALEGVFDPVTNLISGKKAYPMAVVVAKESFFNTFAPTIGAAGAGWLLAGAGTVAGVPIANIGALGIFSVISGLTCGDGISANVLFDVTSGGLPPENTGWQIPVIEHPLISNHVYWKLKFYDEQGQVVDYKEGNREFGCVQVPFLTDDIALVWFTHANLYPGHCYTAELQYNMQTFNWGQYRDRIIVNNLCTEAG